MKVILYMAITANGYIAKENDDTSWISTTESNSYSTAVRSAGCLIMGRRTYGIITKQSEFTQLLKDVKVIIVSKGNVKTLASNHLTARSPKEALELAKNFKEVIVAGGGILDASFISANLVDEIYLDIEPIVFSKGIKLFENKNFEIKLQLLDIKKLSDNEVQLHYQVLSN